MTMKSRSSDTVKDSHTNFGRYLVKIVGSLSVQAWFCSTE